MENNPTQDELTKKINEVVEQAKIKKGDFQQVERNLQRTVDIGEATLPLVSSFDHNEIKNQYQIWVDAEFQVNSISPMSHELLSSTDYIAGTASMSSASVISYFGQNSQVLNENLEINNEFVNYKNVVNDESLILEIIQHLQTLNLDSAPKGKNSPLDCFKIAIDAYKSPVSGEESAITSLLPLRSSITIALGLLLKYRPKQEKTGTDEKKIISIFNQLGKSNVTVNMVNGWIKDWGSINNYDLSDSKESRISRAEWIDRFFRVCHFYLSFLSGLDPAKFRKTKS